MKIDPELTDRISRGVLVALIIGGAIWCSSREKNKIEYNKIFLEQIDRLPRKGDTIDFYKNHKLNDYLVLKNPIDTMKNYEENIKILPLPYKEIRKIVKGVR